MTGRSVPEWIGATPDSDIPKLVKARVWRRCNGKCALTGRKLTSKDDVDFDHIKPLSMGGRHAESNLQIVWRPAHRDKTAEEASPRAKADRNFLKHNGLWPKSKRPIQSRGFEKRSAAR